MTRIREAGDSGLLLELDEVIDARVNAQAIAVAHAIRSMPIPGLRDVVPTYRSVAIFFDPLLTEPDTVRDALAREVEVPLEVAPGRTIEVPVVYGGESGPDLTSVADWAGLSPAAVVDRHAGTDYRVFMLGFLPGFAYLGSVDERIAAPRRDTPRARVRAGAVGIAGRQTGIYPMESPGGWQIIGRTPRRMFDLEKAPAAIMKPGDMVRFVPMPSSGDAPATPAKRSSPGDSTSRMVTVLRPGLFTTVQDLGRWGHQASGVPVGGALDLISHRLANLLVGNHADAATLEVTLTGPELRFDHDAVVAVTGADLQATIDGRVTPLGAPSSCRAGSVLRFGERRLGTRAYIAVDGGVDVGMVLGSRATHVGAGLGGLRGEALTAGDRVPLGRPAASPVTRPAGQASSVRVSGGARLRVMPGPQDDFFPDAAFTTLEGTRFLVTPQSNRMGYRLSGGSLARVDRDEMISDAAFVGGIQVPSSGQPILLMSDRQTTGGYPQIATVITADLPLAGQLAPGDWVEFARCSRTEALAALLDQEAKLRALA